MKTIVLIACCSKKLSVKAEARDLYTSPLFKKSLEYAKKIAEEQNIYILSAKHELVSLSEVLAPYNETLNNKSTDERRVWSKNVLQQLEDEGYDLENDEFVLLAGNNYIDYLIEGRKKLDRKQIKNAKLPLEGLPIGKRMQKLNSLIK